MDPPERAPDGYCSTFAVTLLVPLGFMLRDLARVTTTAPWSLSVVDASIFVTVGTAIGALVLGAMLLPRHALVATLSVHGRSGQALIGAVDGTALSILFVLLQSPSFLVDDLRIYVTLGAIAVFAALRFGWSTLAAPTRAMVAHTVALACVIGCGVLLSYLRWNGDWWLKLLAQAVIAVSLDHFAFSLGVGIGRRVFLGVACIALVLVVASGSILHVSPQAHNALMHGSIHARVWIQPVQRAADVDRDGVGPVFGGIDEDVHQRDARGTREEPRASQRHGAAAGSDVLLLSLDSLRWDAVGQLDELWNEIGPHARFERAVSPAPGTKESLSATIRGMSVRQLQFEDAPQARGKILWRDTSPTLGHMLVKAGYRALTVPTSNVADPRIGIASGFEHVWVANHDARFEPATRSPFTQRYVPSEQIVPIALSAARETRHPLCVWLHVMETHYPFHLAPATDAGLRPGSARFHQSVKETAHRFTFFLRQWKALRGRAPIIAVFGDHGEEFGEHGGDHHASTVYAEQVRVTFVLAGPEVPPGRYDAPVSIGSIPATVLDLLGLTVARSMTEPSLLPLMLSEAQWPPLAVSEAQLGTERVFGYTGTKHRYVWDPIHRLEQLFDSQMDPLDQRDVALSQPEALTTMRRMARAWDETH